MTDDELQAITDVYADEGSAAAAHYIPKLVEALRAANKWIAEQRADPLRCLDLGDGF